MLGHRSVGAWGREAYEGGPPRIVRSTECGRDAPDPSPSMSRTTHVCAGCGAELSSKRDLEKVSGAVYATWRCRHCGTTVPGTVAEKLKHQRQH